MKYKQSNDVSTLAQKYSPVFKKTTANSERVTHESYMKLISWVALYMVQKTLMSVLSNLPGRAIDVGQAES